MWAKQWLMVLALPMIAIGAERDLEKAVGTRSAVQTAWPHTCQIQDGFGAGDGHFGLFDWVAQGARYWHNSAPPDGLYNRTIAAIVRQTPRSFCYAPGTPPDVIEYYDRLKHIDPGPLAYFLGGRWSGVQGSPRALTWSFVPDGLAAEGSSSILFARMNNLFSGDTQAWISLFEQCFDRWEELTGTSYTRITAGSNEWDDGASWGAVGSATRGDIRIAMGTIDGNSNVLAFNYFPSNGDMFMDFAESWGASSNNWRFLRDVVMHEHGHGLGMRHVCSSDSSQLMEPFINTSFDGPQHDDLRAGQRHYGDPFEPDDDFNAATDLGVLTTVSPILSPQIPSPNISNSDLTSIDANGEQDWYRFSITEPFVFLEATLTPHGLVYDSSPQQSNGSCTSGNNINSLVAADLALEVYDSDGSTLLASASSAPAGQPESVVDVGLTGPADYFIRVFETDLPSEPQFYGFDLALTAPGACCLANGDCTLLRAGSCALTPGFYQGDGTTCPPDPACTPVDTMVTCELESALADAGSTVRVNLFVEEATNLGAYQATLQVVNTGGAGTVGPACPDGARINEMICITGDTFEPTGDACDTAPCPAADPPNICIGRPDYAFANQGTVIGADCEGMQVVAALLSGSVDVVGQRKYIGDILLEVSPDAEPGATFDIEFVPNTEDNLNFLLDGGASSIPTQFGAPCTLTVTDPTSIDKNRYVSFRTEEPGPVAYKLDMTSSLFHPTATVSGWVGQPDANGIATLQANPLTRVWSEPVVHITGCDITPVAEFELRASFDGGGSFEPPVALRTAAQPAGDKFWGDTVGFFDGAAWTPPQGFVNIDDIVAALKTFQQAAGAPEVPRTDVVPQEPNRLVNINDAFAIILAFQGKEYPFGCPDDPCQDNMANPCP